MFACSLVYSPVVFFTSNKSKRDKKALEACIFYLCIPSWLLCAVIIYSLHLSWLDVSGSSFWNCLPLETLPSMLTTSVTHFFSLSLPIKTVCAHTELGSCTDVGRIPNFILILSACQFWKGEAGQKIIGRTSHKCECGEQQMWVVEVEGWGLPLGLPKARLTIVQRRSHFCGCYNNHNTLSMSLRSR